MTSRAIIFDNPPINEVVIATYFDPPLAALQSQHIGLFWEQVRDTFPNVEQRVPASIEAEVTLDLPFPMPRYWFVASDDVHLIQVQKNAFMFNWRQRNKEVYPGFEALKPQFDKHFSAFEEFLRREVDIADAAISHAELTYIDVIEEGAFWGGPGSTHQVIPDLSSPVISPSTPLSNLDWQGRYQLSDDTGLFIRARTGFKPNQTDSRVLILEMKAVGSFPGVRRSATDDWFQRAHASIFEVFVDITGDDIQRDYWGKREVEQI